ncbi:GNAT family N-acetyltransferase [Azospirillum rugosum]|uniref:GNAT superfamily N-acetyltransferase n=1 Tax=Azospirillum rugosum TaxID=416170 RepID=A0ABS4SWI3_9PROT|nr:GNAT family N-acetyltransferase [Azospirillum rugosum]MBP2296910.1 GNAT superfamily N-acetyltransferase [Azospirillum rugosum]MDQ0530669.1 GNAT superfamily N-acetyltransferase [Azospirillum rugosum]
MRTGWRAMEPADLDRVMAIAEVVHPDYPEERAVFAERLALFPDGCLMALAEGTAVGYAVMHPGRLGAPPPLDSPLGALPEGADCLYLHDVALLPAARGLGLGVSALERMEGIAAGRGFAWLALTSTPKARAFWDRNGFTPYDGGPALAAKLASYGGGMAYMTRPVRKALA